MEIEMKTTIEMPDELFRKAKAVAALRGQSMKQFITHITQSIMASLHNPINAPSIPTGRPTPWLQTRSAGNSPRSPYKYRQHGKARMMPRQRYKSNVANSATMVIDASIG